MNEIRSINLSTSVLQRSISSFNLLLRNASSVSIATLRYSTLVVLKSKAAILKSVIQKLIYKVKYLTENKKADKRYIMLIDN